MAANLDALGDDDELHKKVTVTDREREGGAPPGQARDVKKHRASQTALMPVERIVRTIVRLRGHNVMLASDLARIYGVETRVLNQAVKRNAGRFPRDFAFRLTRYEAVQVERSRSQTVILKRGRNIKYAPLAFTEYGAIMAATVLNSPRAVQMSIVVVRAFVGLRQVLQSNAGIAKKLEALEMKYDEQFEVVFQVIRELMTPPAASRKRIGFRPAKS
jgi:hypothetical protein